MTAVFLHEPPDVLREWLDRRRALGQDGFDEVTAAIVVEIIAPNDESTDRSALLGVSTADLIAEIECPD